MTAAPPKIRVMIVEDSRVVREFLRDLIDRHPRLDVVAAVDSGEEALRVLPRAAPQVISMDLRLPGMNGFETTRRIMRDSPTPIVVVSAAVSTADRKVAMRAMQAGALSVIEKPVGTSHADYARLAAQLCSRLVLMSEVRLVRQRRILQSSAEPIGNAVRTPERAESPAASCGPFEMLGIVASTGGPNAVQELLVDLGAGFPLPIVLVQHMTDSFMEGFASWLNSVSPLPVGLARDGERPAPGRVYVAPADRHVALHADALRLEDGPPVATQRPSGTVLFRSLAGQYGPRSLGVLMTGMGEDGAEGLKELHDAGGYTIAEHESTAVVYGMPAAAVRLGAVRESLPRQRIGRRIRQLMSPAHARLTQPWQP